MVVGGHLRLPGGPEGSLRVDEKVKIGGSYWTTLCLNPERWKGVLGFHVLTLSCFTQGLMMNPARSTCAIVNIALPVTQWSINAPYMIE